MYGQMQFICDGVEYEGSGIAIIMAARRCCRRVVMMKRKKRDSDFSKMNRQAKTQRRPARLSDFRRKSQ